MSSAKRRSSSAGWPSPKSNPFKGMSRLQPVIAHCSTAKKTRGLRTHPCLTPGVMGKLRLDPHLPRTSPDWPSYSFDSIHIMWSEMPWARNAFQRVGQCTRSNAFERSKLTIQTGIPCAVALSRNKLAVSKCSSSRYFERNPCRSSGWWVSSVCSIRPRIKYAKTLYSNRKLAIGLKPLTCIARSFLGNMWKQVVRQQSGTTPSSNAELQNRSKAVKNSSGTCRSNPAETPRWSGDFFSCNLPIAIRKSCIVQASSVKATGFGNDISGPTNKFSNMSANYPYPLNPGKVRPTWKNVTYIFLGVPLKIMQLPPPRCPKVVFS